jgi:hypothetical protein
MMAKSFQKVGPITDVSKIFVSRMRKECLHHQSRATAALRKNHLKPFNAIETESNGESIGARLADGKSG